MVTAARPRHRFYLAMACVGALIAATGFSRRYFLPLAAGTFDAPAIVHLHGVITFTWIAFVIVQTTLIATGRTAYHRSIGMAGIALGTLLVYTAAQVAILQLARELRVGGPSPREFVATLLSLPLLVTGLLAFGIANVDRPEIHKRLMMLATFVVLTPALARIIQLLDGSLSRLMRNDLAGLASDALVLFAIAYDARTRGKPHPAYLVGGGCIVLVQLLVLVARSTSPWYGVTNWLASLVA
jgi:uncharacterized membrane protein YidH (DUF202 family)